MKTFLFWQRWLLVVAVLVTLFGAVMSLFHNTPLFSLFNSQIDPVFWGSEAPSGRMLGFQRWVYGAWGATVAGWGLTLTFIANNPYKRKERWARNSIIAGLALWFLLDTGASIYFGVYFNAYFNGLLLLLAALPLAFTWSSFNRDDSDSHDLQS